MKTATNFRVSFWVQGEGENGWFATLDSRWALDDLASAEQVAEILRQQGYESVQVSTDATY